MQNEGLVREVGFQYGLRFWPIVPVHGFEYRYYCILPPRRELRSADVEAVGQDQENGIPNGGLPSPPPNPPMGVGKCHMRQLD
ncbi:hypothetical protein V6N13_074290 [Hibiscus sabdariffa]